MAPHHPPALGSDVHSSSNPATSTPLSPSPKTQDASTDTHSPRRDSGYESPSLSSNPPRRSHTSNADAPPLQQIMSSSRTSSHPTTSHRSSSSAPRPSRRSSFLLQPLPQAPLPRPQPRTRAASDNHLHLRHNPFLPPSSTPATPKTPRVCSFPSPTNHNHSFNHHCPSNHHYHSTSLPSPPPAYSNYHPAPAIDWTLPSTRRKEYDARERERRGLRGLWRRIVPGSCIRNQSATFFASEKEGSVRRLRVDLDDGEKEEGEGWEKEGGAGGAGDEVALKGMRGGRRGVSGWGCWGIGSGAATATAVGREGV